MHACKEARGGFRPSGLVVVDAVEGTVLQGISRAKKEAEVNAPPHCLMCAMP